MTTLGPSHFEMNFPLIHRVITIGLRTTRTMSIWFLLLVGFIKRNNINVMNPFI